jgi:Oxidoreductase family, NAD-binding Rossmann fold
MRTVFSRRVFLSSATSAALAHAGRGATPANSIRVGIAGLGSRGNANLWGLTHSKGVHVVALSEPNRGRLERAAAVLARRQAEPAELACDYWELLHRTDLDAIAIALPSHLNLEAACKFCQARKHVFLAVDELLNLEDSARIEMAAARSAKSVQVFDPRFDGHRAKIRQTMQELFRNRPHAIGIYVSGLGIEESLRGDVLGVIGLCRQALGVGLPTRVVAMECPGRALTISFEFEGAEQALQPRAARLRWDTVEGYGAAKRVAIAMESARGSESLEFSLSASQDGGESASVELFQEFARAIRSGDPTLLTSPISEARRTDGLIRLAGVARTTGHPVQFDPAGERFADNMAAWQDSQD